MNISQKQFLYFFWTISIVSLIVIAFRSFFIPFCHDEAATFFMFVQSGNYMPFYSNTDANNHVLNSVLSNICYHLFGSSPFSLRIPNLVGFVVLIFAAHKITNYLEQGFSKVFITLALLFFFHWLSFYSVCRGYGLSMAFLALAIANMLNYIKVISNKRYFVFAVLCFQLAVSSNLILIIVVLVLSGVLMLIQLANKKLISFSTIFIWLLHFALLYYWLRFSFYLQDKGALYLGSGASYWQVTFLTLQKLLIGNDSIVVQVVVLFLFVGTILSVIILNRKEIGNLKMPQPDVWLAAAMCILILAFYLMRKLLNINYPEDRTGMFFYLFFVLVIAFSFDKLKPSVNTILLGFLSILIVIHYALNINFRKHSLADYETIPNHFYDTLVKEQQKSKDRITIGGHRLRELFYGFINYRHNGLLNSADPVESMHMNADYYIARNYERPYFEPFYNVIDSEPDWGFLVVKRKQFAKRVLLFESKNKLAATYDEEYRELYSLTDTTSDTRALLAEVNFDVKEIPVPNNIWLVFQVSDSLDNYKCYYRYPLYWMGDNLNGRKNLCYDFISGNLPKGKKTIVCYFWNIKKEPFFIKVNSFKLYRLEGDGVQVVAPEEN